MYIKYMKVIRRIYIVKLYFQALFSILLSVFWIGFLCLTPFHIRHVGRCCDLSGQTAGRLYSPRRGREIRSRRTFQLDVYVARRKKGPWGYWRRTQEDSDPYIQTADARSVRTGYASRRHNHLAVISFLLLSWLLPIALHCQTSTMSCAWRGDGEGRVGGVLLAASLWKIFFWIARMSGCISQECICACFPCRYREKLCVSEEGWLAFERDYSLQPVIGAGDDSVPVACRDVCVCVFICARIRVTVFRVSVLSSVVFLLPGCWFGFLVCSSAP